jgi:hypothetical protein
MSGFGCIKILVIRLLRWIVKLINTKDIGSLALMGASILLSRSFNETKDTVDSRNMIYRNAQAFRS